MPLLLLLVPLALLALVALWVVLLPFGLWQRYRLGKARRRALRWAVHVNAWALAVSIVLFLAGAWLGGHWIAGALPHAALGLASGTALGIVGVWLSRFEHTERGLYYTPNRWLALGLTLLVAGRIALGLWQAWHHLRGGGAAQSLPDDQASLLAIGGLLLGYYAAYAFGVRRRLAPHPDRRVR